MSTFSAEIVGSFCSESLPAVPPTRSAPAPTVRANGYESMPAWGARRWESAETNRLNEAHWQWANDESINAWLAAQLPTLRARTTYEAKNNPVILGMLGTHADDVVGPDGPTLQVQSSDKAYNEGLEAAWRQWFRCPTHHPSISGAAMLKLWVKNLWKCGSFLARKYSDSLVDTPVALRLRLMSPRRLGTPAQLAGNSRVFMGVEYDTLGRPMGYHIADQDGIGTGVSGASLSFTRVPAEDVVYEFLWDEEDQGAGVPLLAAGLQSAADLRDFDDQIQDAARQMADQMGLMYADGPDVPFWNAPESTTVQRRAFKMLPPGWKPFTYPATQPPVQYPDYRAERQLDLGRPASMPRLLVRMDASKHSWASARLDMTTYTRAVRSLQAWISGTERSTGTLNRLVDDVAREARFSDARLRTRPADVSYHWEWPQIDPVEPNKQAEADEIALRAGTRTLIEILASRNKTLEMHIEEMRRVQEAYDAVPELAKPSWLTGVQQGQAASSAAATPKDSDQEQAVEDVLDD